METDQFLELGITSLGLGSDFCCFVCIMKKKKTTIIGQFNPSDCQMSIID